ncbi:S-layer homology domain-containing protein [Ureibacillus sp. MALMAid1270]|uniref:S-layer homology domain-containing protein n=1 Tax=Ureibacillus sp. MALMAid1270 TaxID=3411629 RepID=UPI003BA5798D
MKFIRKLTAFVIVLIVLLSMSTTSTLASTKTTQFKDIPSNYWAKKEIDELVSKKIISGFSDGTFKPNKNMTRAETAVMIGKALNISIENRPDPNFTDVNTSNSAYPYIVALTEEGVFAKATKFNPNAFLTRSQMAKILVKAFNLKGTSSTTFNDVPKNHWAYSSVQTLVSVGVTSGTTSTTFNPNGYVTRAQMAAFVKRTLDYQAVSEILPIANEVLKLVNAERAKVKVPPLKLNMGVTKVAQIKAQDMYDNDYFDHRSPTYGYASEMLKYFGVDFDNVAENAATGQLSAQEVVTDWMNSPGHRSNILDSYGTEIGIGVVQGEKGTFWVQMFIHK